MRLAPGGSYQLTLSTTRLWIDTLWLCCGVQAWKRICEASRREFQAIYDRLGVRLIERGESSYNPALRPLVEDLCARGIAEDSDGAKVPGCSPEPSPNKVFCVYAITTICGRANVFKVYDKRSKEAPQGIACRITGDATDLLSAAGRVCWQWQPSSLGPAQVVWVEGEKVPLMVQKTDGGFGYGTTDMAALRQRVHDERGEWLIYVVDEGQSGHFKHAPTSPVTQGAARQKDRLLCVVLSVCVSLPRISSEHEYRSCINIIASPASSHM